MGPDAAIGVQGMLVAMSFLRFIARSLVASAFIVDGVQKVRHPEESAQDAERFTSVVTPVVQRAVPASYSSWVPEEAGTWVRAAGGAEIVGGVMFATGIGRRLGAALLAKASILNVTMALPGKDASKAEKQAARPEILTNLALLGSTVLAVGDLQGKPSLLWRAEQGAERAGRKLTSEQEELRSKAKKKAQKAGKKAKKAAKKAKKTAADAGKKLDSVMHS